MDILDKWIDDMPQQFHGKKNIESLISVFSKQLEELHRVFEQLDKDTDIDTAVGVNLDRVGSIACMSRLDAQTVLRKMDIEELSDELYKSALRYQILKNNCDCTYEDIVNSIKTLWEIDNFKYIEQKERPATICIKFPHFDLNADDLVAERILAIKPAGVKLLYLISYYSSIYSDIEEVRLDNIILRLSISHWNCRVFDGTWLLNGSHFFNAVRGKIDHRLGIRSGVKSDIERFDNAHVIFKNNLWRLDGTYLLDGTRQFNAVCREEVV